MQTISVVLPALNLVGLAFAISILMTQKRVLDKISRKRVFNKHTEEKPKRKQISEKVQADIFYLHKFTNMTQSKIADIVGVSQVSVSKIVRTHKFQEELAMNGKTLNTQTLNMELQ